MSLMLPESVAMLATIASVIIASTPAYSAIVCPSLRLRRYRMRGMIASCVHGLRGSIPTKGGILRTKLAQDVLEDYHERALRVIFYRQQWIYDLAFWLFARFAPVRRAVQWLLVLVASPGLLRLVRSVRPDVIVSVYPVTTEVLGGLRRRGRLDIPVCAA